MTAIQLEHRRHPRLREVPVVADAVSLLWSLAQSAFTSPVSGLLNKAAYAELDRVARNAAEVFIVAFADLSGFKRVNDEFSHIVGDALLLEVGRRLETFAGSSDATAYHLSGDEFAIVFRGMDTERVTALSRDVSRVRIDVVDGGVAEVGLHYGYAPADADETLMTLLSRAEAAAVVAKSTKSVVPIAWNAGFESEPLVDPRKKCSTCGATTTVLVAAARRQDGVPKLCGNCGIDFDVAGSGANPA